MLGRCLDVTPASSLGDHSYVAFLTVDSVDEFYARAVAEQAEVLKPPTDEPWGRREMAYEALKDTASCSAKRAFVDPHHAGVLCAMVSCGDGGTRTRDR